jgi:hypothetical protein
MIRNVSLFYSGGVMTLRLIILCSLLILVSCGNSVLEKGKGELKNGNYQEALEHFEDAKIDQPNNEDIDKLIEMTNSKINDTNFRADLKNYSIETVPYVLNLYTIYENMDFNNLTIEEIQNANKEYVSISTGLKNAYLKGNFELYGDPNYYLKSLKENFEKILTTGLDKIHYDEQQEEEERLRKEAKEKAQKSESTYDDILSKYEPPKALSFVNANYTAAITMFKQNYDSYMEIINRLKQDFG